MGTKLRNFKYTKFAKVIMLILAIIMVGIGVNTAFWFYNIQAVYGVNDTIYYYDDGDNSYYDIYRDTSLGLSDIYTIEQLNNLVIDGNENPAHEVLNINIGDYVDKGIRYIIVDSVTGEIIGSDGTNQNDINFYNLENDTIVYYDSEVYIDSNDVNKDTIKNLNLKSFGNGYIKQYKIMYGFTDEIASEISQISSSIERIMIDKIYFIIGLSIIFLIILIYFAVVSGKKSFDSEVKYWAIDKIYVDILIFAVATIIIGSTVLFYSLFEIKDKLLYNQQYFNIVVYSIVIAVSTVFIVSNIGKRYKDKKLLYSISVVSISNFICKKIFKYLNNVFNKDTSLNIKILSIATFIISFLAIVITGEIIFTIILAIIVVLLLNNSVSLSRAINKIKKGYIYKSSKSSLKFPFNTTFKDLENISENIDKIAQKSISAQRTKTELITNVSHDLRTPLTSIIGYIDLMEKKNEQYDEETNEYIKIIRDKSIRMSNMVEDVFDLSKSVSGDINLEKEEINVKKLIEQTLSEFEDSITDETMVEVKLDESIYIFADGNKMYRVLQNLIENALKYSLSGTRIYVQAFKNIENEVIIEVKNISNYKMDFSEDDIIQRFTRGDEARTTKGSGLGLSIAKTYTNINDGEFKVFVDGDMFKVVLKFKIL